jgi:F-type H+-transporting ATPase subunit epsilon
MSKNLSVKIVTPEEVVISDDYIKATFPTLNGEISILANHIPLVSLIKAGEIKLETASGRLTNLSVSSGILEVRPNSQIVILADTAERAEHINIEKAEEARQRVQKLLEEKSHAREVDYARLQAVLEKEMARIKVGRKYKKIKTKIS